MNKYVEQYIKTKRVTSHISHPITDEVVKGLEEVVNEYGDTVFTRGKSVLSARTIGDTIPTMIANDVSSIVENLKAIPTVARNSLKHYELLYGQNAESCYAEKIKKSVNSLDTFIARHGEESGRDKFTDLISKKKKQNTLGGYIERYGDEQGRILHLEYVNKCKKSHTIEGYIEKYGISEGSALFEKLYEVPRLCLERMIDKYGDEGVHKYAEIRSRINKFKGARASNESLTIFLPLLEEIQHLTTYIGYEDKKEYFLWNLDDREFYQYDLFIKELNLIFEYNGEHVHPRMDRLTEDQIRDWRCAWTGRTAKEAAEYNNRKKVTAEKTGISVVELWRGDGVEFNLSLARSIIQSKMKEVNV